MGRMSGHREETSGPPVEALLDAFLLAADPGPFAYGDCHHFPGSRRHERHLVLGFAIHGNEFGTLPALLALQSRLQLTPPEGPVTLLLGNVPAIRQDVRFLEEDFNRVFTFDRPATSRERRRAEAVRPILESADVFLDFHQTQTPTQVPFWTFPFTPELALWARAIGGAAQGLTRAPAQAFSPGQKCLDEYVRERGRIGLTLEVGFRGLDPDQAERTEKTARNALSVVDQWARGEASLEQLAERGDEIRYFETAYVLGPSPALFRLRPGLSNWTALAEGELLSAAGTPEVRSPCDGFALFPKYPAPGEPPPPELLRIARGVDDPARAFAT